MDLAIRPARPDEYETFGRLIAQLGSNDPLPPRTMWEDEFCPQTLFAERGGAVVGYVYAQALRDTGYVRNLVTDATARRTGVGAALMAAAAARLRAAGCARWCLNVKPDNAAALALYEGLGLRVMWRGVSLATPWSAVATLPEPTATARTLRPADDDRVERAWDLPPGQLALARAHGRVLLGLDDAAGVSCFNTAYPGAFPFRARDLPGAAALLRAMRPHARPEHDFVRLMVESDDALERALLDRGATVALETVHMRGPIPA